MDWNWLNNFIDWWTTARVAAASASVAALAAVTAATSGIRTLRQSRRDSKSKSRPMVAAELRAAPHNGPTQILVVRNYGPSIARNVRVTFDPPIPDPDNPATSVIPFLKERYANPIPVLTPGMELDNVYYFGQSADHAEPVPEQVTVTIAYESDAGDPYVDAFPLDVNLIRNRTYSTSSASPEAQMKVMAKSLKGLHDIAKRSESSRRRAEHAAQAAAKAGVLDGSDSPAPLATGEPAGHRSLVRRMLPHKYRDQPEPPTPVQ